VEAYTNYQLSNHLAVLAGADYRFQNTDQHYYSLSSFGPHETKRGKDTTNMNQSSLFGSVFLQQLGGFHLELGGRYNKHSEYGSNFTYTFNPSYLIANKVKLFANVASAFKAPSLYQLFVVGAAATQPLKAEKSRTYEGGVEYNNGKGIMTRAVYFNREIENGIEYNMVNFRYFNNNLQKDHGFELEASVKAGIVDINANYTYVTGEVNTAKFAYDAATWSYKNTGDTTYNNLFRRPKNTLNINVGVAPIENLYVSAHARFAGKRFEPVYLQRPIEMENYHTIDLYTEYRFSKAIKAFVDLKNITNEQLFDVRGYNSRRFNFMAGLNFNL
jgi:vitamin B12 transporter